MCFPLFCPVVLWYTLSSTCIKSRREFKHAMKGNDLSSNKHFPPISGKCTTGVCGLSLHISRKHLDLGWFHSWFSQNRKSLWVSFLFLYNLLSVIPLSLPFFLNFSNFGGYTSSILCAVSILYITLHTYLSTVTIHHRLLEAQHRPKTFTLFSRVKSSLWCKSKFPPEIFMVV